ncbi:MAG: YkvA family protein [Candidatus Sericytochromatia bacterium]
MSVPNESSFNQADFWRHVRRFMAHVPFMKDVLAMFFASQDRRTPMWVKGMIGAALAYFALPIDAVPEAVFLGLGFTDDAAVIFATLRTVSSYVHDDHREQAENWLQSNG